MINTGEQNSMGKPYQVIRFNKLTGQLEKPTILLKTRGGNTIGELQYTNLNFSFVGKGLDNLSFDVHKVVNGKECKYWDKLIDLCIIDYVGYGQFECNVTINDEDETIKSCVCESLETELGQHTIRDMHINDEDAITYGRKVGNTNVDFDTGETSGKFIPTVLYDKNDQQHSLLDRVLAEKTPHWTVGYVSPQFAVNGYVYDADQIERTFTLSGTTPYDFFDSEVSQEFGCVFTYDTYNRKVNCYNLDACVYDKSTNEIKEGYYYIDGIYYDENDNQIIDDSNLGYCSGIGQDTTIFMSKSKLANSFSIDSDAGSVKNCFYVSGGDDEITNIVGAANVTGDNYIYMFGNFQYEDMSDELVNKIKSYATLLSEKEEEFNKVGGVYVYDSDGKYEYNTEKQRIEDKNGRIIVNSKYVNGRIYVLDTLAYFENGVAYNKDRKVLSSSDYIYDKPGLYTEYTSLVDRINYWEHTRFPDVTPSDTTAEDEKEKIIEYFSARKVYIKNGCTSTSFAHVTSAIESLIGIACDSRYTITIYKDKDHTLTCSDIDDEHNIGVWNGVVNIKRTTDETDYTEFNLSVNVELTYDIDNSIGLCKQNMEIAIARMDIVELDFTKLSKDELEKLLRQYNLNSLKSFRDGFDSCRATLNDLLANMELEEAEVVRFEDDAMLLSLDRYNERYDVANSLYIELEEYIDELSSQKEVLEDKIDSFRADLDMRTIFGEELWKEFRSYVREDEYNNPNYISDGLSNCEILEKAKELLDVAKKELSKACVIQKTISGDINNIFSLEEKELLHDKFALFNYVRVRADDNIYKLRLMEISFSEDSPEKLNVTFSEQIEDVSGKKSDVQKILEQSQSIATTYSSTTKQAKQGASAMSNFNTLKQEGLDSSLYLIKNSNTEEVTFGNTGLSCKSMLDQGIYSPYEVRVTHNGIYMSEDNFNSVNTALGRFKYNDEWVYGVNTSVLFGDLIMGEKMIISNKNGSVNITGDGITLDGGAITWIKKLPSSSVEGLDDTVKDFVDAIGDLQSQIDGEITSWFEEYEPTTTNEPASTWITDADKIKHEGDLFYNTATGAAYRYIYNSSTKQHEWSVITDTAITEALEKASKAQDTADKKRRVFVVTPTPPYDIGDLWSQGSDGDLMKCKVAKTEGQTYSASDWEKASKYTDDTAWKTWTSDSGEFGKYKEDIKKQIDGKSNCTYGGSTPPSNPGTGDLWFCTDGSGSYDSNKAYMYNGTSWAESNGVPDSVWDIADGKSSIFVVKPNKALSSVDSNFYHKNDIWILESDMTLNGISYKKGSILTSISDSTSFVESHWVEKVRYTDDTTAQKALEQAKQGITDAADALSRANNAYSRAENAETNAKKYADSQDTTLSTNITDAYEQYTTSAVRNFDEAVAAYLQVPGATTIVGGNHVISPYIEGGYLNITNGNKQVIVDPSNQTKTGYIFAVKNGTEFTVGIKADGTTNIKGHLTALSLDLNGNKISSSDIDDLNTTIEGYGYQTANQTKSIIEAYGYQTSNNVKSIVTSYGYQDANEVKSIVEGYGYTTNSSVYQYLIDGNYFLVSGTKLNEITGYTEFANSLVLKSSISSTVKTETITTPGGVTKERTVYTTTIPNSDGTSKTFHTYDDGSYILTNVGIGNGSSDPSSSTSTDTYVMIDKNGCLTADNAVIRGTIYATNGYFSGDIKSGSTITCGENFSVNSKGIMTCILGTLKGNLYADKKIYMWNSTRDSTFEFVNVSDTAYLHDASITIKDTEGYNIISWNYEEGARFYGKSNSSTYSDSSHSLRTYNTNGTSHGTSWLLKCQHNKDSDGLFKIYCGDGSIGTKVDYATNATNATNWAGGSISGSITTIGENGLYSATMGKYFCRPYIVDNVYYSALGNNNFGTRIYGSSVWANKSISISDKRLKKDFEEFDDRYDKFFDELKPQTFRMLINSSNRRYTGFVAQDVKKSLDKFCISTNDFAGYVESEADINLFEETIGYNPIDDNKQLGLRYEEFIAINTWQIQKLKKRVSELESEIQQLKQNIE